MKQKAKNYCAGLATAITLITSAASASPYEDGQAAYDRGDYAAALDVWRPLAIDGDTRAQYMLGLASGLGQGVPQDYRQAALWYRKAADQGDAGAQANLGALYASGVDGTENYEEAIKWWRKATF